jgi:hypothetical protein
MKISINQLRKIIKEELNENYIDPHPFGLKFFKLLFDLKTVPSSILHASLRELEHVHEIISRELERRPIEQQPEVNLNIIRSDAQRRWPL